MVLQEWPEEDYPPYANGPGYILSTDIARFIVKEFEQHKLRVIDHFHFGKEYQRREESRAMYVMCDSTSLCLCYSYSKWKT